MDLLKQYFEIQEKIYNYFEYEENWKVIPLNDDTSMYWRVENDSEINYADKPSDLLEDFDEGNYYPMEIYTQRFLNKYIYRGEDYTMIVVDTHTDGNKFLSILDNKKEIKEKPSSNF